MKLPRARFIKPGSGWYELLTGRKASSMRASARMDSREPGGGFANSGSNRSEPGGNGHIQRYLGMSGWGRAGSCGTLPSCVAEGRMRDPACNWQIEDMGMRVMDVARLPGVTSAMVVALK